MRFKLPKMVSMILICSLIASTSWACSPSNVENESSDFKVFGVPPVEDGQNTSPSTDLFTADQVASTPGSFFVPNGENMFKRLIQTPMNRLVEMYQGEPLNTSPHPEYLYDGVGNLVIEEGLSKRKFLSLYPGMDTEIHDLDRAINSQIMVTDEECKVYRVDSWRYWSGNLFYYNGQYSEMDGIEADKDGRFSEAALSRILSDVGLAVEVYAEKIDGTVTYPNGDISNISKIRLWSAEEKTRLPVGWYEGTSWQEGYIDFKTPYYVLFPEPEFTPIPTKLGYFVCDFSSVDQGLYIIMNGEGNSGQLVNVI